MTDVSVHIPQPAGNAAQFRATAGERQSVGRTMGEALDTLTRDWAGLGPTDVLIEPLTEGTALSAELHLENEGGFWVIAGNAALSPENADRDFVAETREERIRSFFPSGLQNNENPS